LKSERELRNEELIERYSEEKERRRSLSLSLVESGAIEERKSRDRKPSDDMASSLLGKERKTVPPPPPPAKVASLLKGMSASVDVPEVQLDLTRSQSIEEDVNDPSAIFFKTTASSSSSSTQKIKPRNEFTSITSLGAILSGRNDDKQTTNEGDDDDDKDSVVSHGSVSSIGSKKGLKNATTVPTATAAAGVGVGGGATAAAGVGVGGGAKKKSALFTRRKSVMKGSSSMKASSSSSVPVVKPEPVKSPITNNSASFFFDAVDEDNDEADAKKVESTVKPPPPLPSVSSHPSHVNDPGAVTNPLLALMAKKSLSSSSSTTATAVASQPLPPPPPPPPPSVSSTLSSNLAGISIPPPPSSIPSSSTVEGQPAAARPPPPAAKKKDGLTIDTSFATGNETKKNVEIIPTRDEPKQPTIKSVEGESSFSRKRSTKVGYYTPDKNSSLSAFALVAPLSVKGGQGDHLSRKASFEELKKTSSMESQQTYSSPLSKGKDQQISSPSITSPIFPSSSATAVASSLVDANESHQLLTIPHSEFLQQLNSKISLFTKESLQVTEEEIQTTLLSKKNKPVPPPPPPATSPLVEMNATDSSTTTVINEDISTFLRKFISSRNIDIPKQKGVSNPADSVYVSNLFRDSDIGEEDNQELQHGKPSSSTGISTYQQYLYERQQLLQSVNYLHSFYYASRERIFLTQLASFQRIITQCETSLSQLTNQRSYLASLYSLYQEEIILKNNEFFTNEKIKLYSSLTKLKEQFYEKEYQICHITSLLKGKQKELQKLQEEYQHSLHYNMVNNQELSSLFPSVSSQSNLMRTQSVESLSTLKTHRSFTSPKRKKRESIPLPVSLRTNANITLHRQLRYREEQRRKENVKKAVAKVKEEREMIRFQQRMKLQAIQQNNNMEEEGEELKDEGLIAYDSEEDETVILSKEISGDFYEEHRRQEKMKNDIAKLRVKRLESQARQRIIEFSEEDKKDENEELWLQYDSDEEKRNQREDIGRIITDRRFQQPKKQIAAVAPQSPPSSLPSASLKEYHSYSVKDMKPLLDLVNIDDSVYRFST
jgi:hypothetical protein